MKNLRSAQDLADVMESERDFYRTFFTMIDKQRERMQSADDHLLPDDFEAVHAVIRRIEASEEIITRAREWQEAEFDAWSQTPQIRDLMHQMEGLVTQCREAARDCERLAREKLERYRAELERMGQGRQLLASLSIAEEEPRYFDHRP
jgi:hypothetical protein